MAEALEQGADMVMTQGATQTNHGRQTAAFAAKLGITPTRPETGCGYLQLARTSMGEAVDLLRFVEKPDALRAQEMLDAGSFLWNAGIFMFRAEDMIEAFTLHSPELLEPVRAALGAVQADLDFLRLDPASWALCADVSTTVKATHLPSPPKACALSLLKTMPKPCGMRNVASARADLRCKLQRISPVQ